jgi:hypothetical protein
MFSNRDWARSGTRWSEWPLGSRQHQIEEFRAAKQTPERMPERLTILSRRQRGLCGQRQQVNQLLNFKVAGVGESADDRTCLVEIID